jgi:GT2 family glycosyltransferase
MEPTISFVLPNYNGTELLRRNLPSVLAVARDHAPPHEVLVVDDASKDDSVAVLEREFPDVRVVRRERNGGFSLAVNTGMAAARGEIVMLLNTDVRLEEPFLGPLLPYFDDPAAFAVAPLMCDEHGRPQRTSCNAVSFRRGEIRRLRWDLADLRARVERGERLLQLYPCGGAAAIRRSQFQELDGLDTLFSPFYYEDFDLGIRAWQRGWKTYFEPRSWVTHEHKGSIAASVARRRVKRLGRRNRFLLLWVHLSSRKLWLSHIPFTAVRVLTRLARLDTVYLPALWSAARLAGEVKKRRRARQGPSLDEIVRALG